MVATRPYEQIIRLKSHIIEYLSAEYSIQNAQYIRQPIKILKTILIYKVMLGDNNMGVLIDVIFKYLYYLIVGTLF